MVGNGLKSRKSRSHPRLLGRPDASGQKRGEAILPRRTWRPLAKPNGSRAEGLSAKLVQGQSTLALGPSARARWAAPRSGQRLALACLPRPRGVARGPSQVIQASRCPSGAALTRPHTSLRPACGAAGVSPCLEPCRFGARRARPAKAECRSFYSVRDGSPRGDRFAGVAAPGAASGGLAAVNRVG